MCANTCHPTDGRPHATAVPAWARRHPLAALPGDPADAATDRGAVPVGLAGPSRPHPLVHARRPGLDAPRSRALALAVWLDVLLAELAAERRRRQAIVDRYEHLLDCRDRHRPTGTTDDGGALDRIREWIGD